MVTTGITVTIGLPPASSSAALTPGCLPSRIKLRVVGNGNLNRPLSPPASASRGDSQIESVEFLAVMGADLLRRRRRQKNQVSNRFGTPSGVIQCA